jgi:AcrR family transcriptional regulator
MSPRNGAPTRAAIVAAASALLESNGPEAVTLRAVGDAAGVSRSAAYRHFDDKADLLAALALQTLLDLAASIRRGSDAGGRGSRLHRGCRAYLLYAVQNPHHFLLIFGDAPIAEPSREIEAAADDGMRAIGELVESAQAHREMVDGPSRELATILWALLHGLAQLHVTGHLSEPRTIEGVTGIEKLLTLALDTLRPVP